MMADLGIAEIRAEGRRLLAEAKKASADSFAPMVAYERPEAVDAAAAYFFRNADVLLADPAPVGLTEDERVTVDWLRDSGDPWDRRVLAIIDRLSAAPVDDREQWCRSCEEAIFGGPGGWHTADGGENCPQGKFHEPLGPARGEYDDLLIERDALREALRIAVDGLERMNPDGPDDCLRVGEYEVACAEVAEAQDWCDACVRFNALAAVRELVDLASPVDPEEG